MSFYKYIFCFLIFASFSFSSIVNGQQNSINVLNEDFIKSLPDSIRKDVISSMNSEFEEDSKKDIFSSFDTKVDTSEAAIRKIRMELERIENRIYGDDIDVLLPFGHNFFNTIPSSFMALENPLVADDYILGTGDTLSINIVGTRSDLITVTVGRDGNVNIPSVGTINLNGNSLSESKKILKSRISKAYLGSDVFVGIKDLKSISIIVSGFVNAPGVYTVPGNSSPLHAVNSAGGIAKNGSYRSIKIKRNDKTIGTYDLYELIAHGIHDTNLNFKNGDVVHVDPQLPVTFLTGSVAKEGIFEIKDGMMLSELLNLSGGILSGLNQKIIIENSQTDLAVTLDVGADDLNIPLNNFDNVRVFSFKPYEKKIKTISIKGEVKNPGLYSIPDDFRLSDAISLAGGFRDTAYEFGGELYRVSAKEREKDSHEKLYRYLIQWIATSSQKDSASLTSGSALPFVLSEFKAIEPKGRVTTEFDLDKISKNSSLDIVLEDNDEIVIPTFSNQVFLLGEIQTNGAKLFNPEYDILDYVYAAGGFSRYADNKRAIIIQPNGDSFLVDNRKLLSFRSEIEVYPGSIIYVPRELGKIDGLNYTATLAPILSSLALSLASLSSISDWFSNRFWISVILFTLYLF